MTRLSDDLRALADRIESDRLSAHAVLTIRNSIDRIETLLVRLPAETRIDVRAEVATMRRALATDDLHLPVVNPSKREELLASVRRDMALAAKSEMGSGYVDAVYWDHGAPFFTVAECMLAEIEAGRWA